MSSQLPEDLSQRYNVVSLLGRGGAGAVYLVDDLKLGRLAAIKVVLSGLVGERAWVLRFKREARVLAALSHPNIVAIYDYVVTPQRAYIIMEYVDGDCLQEVLDCGPIPAKRAVSYIADLADALAFAHEKGVLHRDIKPANIMVSNDEVPKLMDFGLSKVITSEAMTKFTDLTGTRDLLGTPLYMAPEVVCSIPHDERADVYQLGFVLYELLTGRRPFEVEDLGELIALAVSEDPPNIPKPSSIQSGINADLDEIVLEAIAKDPDKRCQKAKTLSEQCKQWLKSGKRKKRSVKKEPIIKVEQTGSYEPTKESAKGVGGKAFGAAIVLLTIIVLSLLGSESQEMKHLNLDVSATRVVAKWRSSAKTKNTCTLLSRGRRRLASVEEKEAKLDHEIVFNKLEPSKEYVLVFNTERVSTEHSFATSSAALLRGVQISILQNMVFAKVPCSEPEATTLLIRDEKGRLLGKKKSLPKGGTTIFALNERIKRGKYMWSVKTGNQLLAGGALAVAYPEQKPLFSTYTDLHGRLQHTEPAAPPIVVGSHVLAIDRSGTLVCCSINRSVKVSQDIESNLKRDWVFRPPSVEPSNFSCVGALAKVDDELFIVAFATKETTEFYCLNVKKRCSLWASRNTVKMSPTDEWFKPIVNSKEWRIVHRQKLNVEGAAVVSARGLFFNHRHHKYDPHVACLDLSAKCLSWSIPATDFLSSRVWRFGSPILSLGEHLGCSYVYTEKDDKQQTELNFFLYPARRTTPSKGQIKRISYRQHEQRQNIGLIPEEETYVVTTLSSLIELRWQGRWLQKERKVSLQNKGSYLSGPAVGWKKKRYVIMLKPNEVLPSSFDICLTSLDGKGDFTVHIPPLCSTVFHRRPPVIRKLLKTGPFIVGLGVREVFAIDTRNSRFGSWARRHTLIDFVCDKGENIFITRADGTLETIPIPLLVSLGTQEVALKPSLSL